MSREFYVPCTPYAYPIRSNLPNFGHRLRRLMKFKSHRAVKNEGQEITALPKTNVLGATSASSENNSKILEISCGVNGNSVVADSFVTQDLAPTSPLNLIGSSEVPGIPSTSSSQASASLSHLNTSEHSVENDSTMSSIFSPSVLTANPMISSGVDANNDDISQRMTLASVMTDDGVIIAGDPLDFAATLNAQLGYDRIRTYAELQARREHEPRSIPLLFVQDEIRRDSFTGSSVSGVNGTSISGSENSIENSMSEVVEDNLNNLEPRRHSEDRDEAQQYYDAALRAAVRKQFRHLDDDPPIY